MINKPTPPLITAPDRGKGGCLTDLMFESLFNSFSSTNLLRRDS